MNNVIHMTRVLNQRPQPRPIAGVGIRNYAGPEDIDTWLQLRQEAFAAEVPKARPWSREDFQVEVLTKWWWDPEAFWLAEATDFGRAVGTVMVAQRGPAANAIPVVHWLAVAPEWRRQGIACLLMKTLQAHCWDKGWRQISLETHAGWQAAMAMYRTLGWEEIR